MARSTNNNGGETAGFVASARAAVTLSASGAPNWSRLVAALREDVAQKSAVRLGGRAWRPTPFRDVALLGPSGDHERRAVSAREALEIEFAEEGADFHAISCDRSGNEIFAYFGAGVHAPTGGETPVADIAFSWAPPQGGRVEESDIQRPELEPGRPAALYAGQSGVALGFSNDACPARLEVAAAGHSETARRLNETMLFIGKRDKHTAPVIALYDVSGARRLALETVYNHRDWWLRDGEWQKVDLRIDLGNYLPLWFRVTNRIGDSVYIDAERARKSGSPAPRLRVLGLLTPELPKFWTFSTGNPSRWTVTFDGPGRLRAREFGEFGVTVAAETMRPFGVFDHASADWRVFGFPGRQLTTIAGSHGVGVFDLDPRSFRGHPGVVKAAPLYGDEWALLRLSDGGAFGEFTIPKGEAALRAGAIDPALARGPEVGLDWLNRCATVRVGGRDSGLAAYWSDRIDAEITLTAEKSWLEVALSNVRGRGVKPYRIQAGGELGLLGPLLVAYSGWD